MRQIEKTRLSLRLGWLLVIMLGLGWSAWLTLLSIRQHEGFHSIGNDLGIYAQIVWTTAHGDPFYTSLTRQTTNFLGHHFVPLVAVFAPLYRLFPDARLLLAGQACALALGAIPLFDFARRRLPTVAAIGITIVYFLSPLLAHIALFEFHEIALAVPLLMAAGAALLNHRYRMMGIWLLLALGAKEEVALIALGFGFYLMLILREWRWGVGVTGGAIAWSLFLFGWFMPSLNTLDGTYTFVQRYQTLGDSPAAMLQTVFTRPQTVWNLITTPAKRDFLVALLLPLAGLPLVGLPALLLAFPTLAYLLLSEYELQVAITTHYSAPLLPFLFLSTAVALQRAYQRGAWIGHGAMLLLGVASLWGYLTLSPLQGGGFYDPTRFSVTAEQQATGAWLASLPSNATIASDWKYFPFLANRRHIDDLLNPSIRPINRIIPDYLITAAPAPDATSAPIYPYLAPELNELAFGELVVPIYQLQSTREDGTQWWQRQPLSVSLQRVDQDFERGMVLVGAGGAWRTDAQQAGDTLAVWLAWGAREVQPERLTFTLQLFRGEERVAQVDREMGNGRFPTSRWHDWLAQPVVVDAFPLSLPADLPAGDYELRAGLYESGTVQTLTTPDGAGLVSIGTVRVVAP